MAVAAMANAIFRHSFAVIAAFPPGKIRLNIIAAALADRYSRCKLLFAAGCATSHESSIPS